MAIRRAILPVAGLLALIVTLAYWLVPFFSAPPQGLLDPGNRDMVALGASVYRDQCASCHGENLQGQSEDWRTPGPDGMMPAPPHDESGHTWHHPDPVLFDITRRGVAAAADLKDYRSAMPGFKDVLTDEEIIAVLSFIKSTWPQQLQHRHDALNARYAAQSR